MTSGDTRDRMIAALRDQVEALEEILRRRSGEVRTIQKLACPKDRLMIESVLDGGGPREIRLALIHDYYAFNWLDESTQFQPSSVEDALNEAWHMAPERLDAHEDSS